MEAPKGANVLKFKGDWAFVFNKGTKKAQWVSQLAKRIAYVTGSGGSEKIYVHDTEKNEVFWVDAESTKFSKATASIAHENATLNLRIVVFNRNIDGAKIFWQIRGLQVGSLRLCLRCCLSALVCLSVEQHSTNNSQQQQL